VVLGRGKPLFGNGAIPAGLRPTFSKIASTGVIMATYNLPGPSVGNVSVCRMNEAVAVRGASEFRQH
jgi:hypothetical protein